MAQSHIKLSGGVGDGARIANTITQVNHGFVVGQAIRFNRTAATGTGSNKYVLAKADEPENSEVVGVVTSVIGADNFTLTYAGEVDISTFDSSFALADDDVFFLSDTTAGLMTKTPPTAAGAVIKPVLVRTNNNTAILTNYVGTVIGGTSVVSLDGIQPVGTIEPFAGSSADVPNTWSLCDGGGLNVSEYPDLYTRLGKTFGYYVKVNSSNTISSGIKVGHYAEARNPEGGFQTSGIITEKTDNYVVIEVNHLSLQNDVLRPHNTEFGSGLAPIVVVPKNTNSTHTGAITETIDQPTTDITISDITVTVEKLRKPDLRGKFVLGQVGADQDLTAIDLPTTISNIDRGEFGGQYISTGLEDNGNFQANGSGGISNMPPYQAMNWIIKITPRAKAALLDNLTAGFKLADLADVNAPEISARSGDVLIYDALSADGAKYRPYRLFTDYPDNAENVFQIVMDSGSPRIKIGNTALTQGFGVDLDGLAQETLRVENQGNVGIDIKTSDDGSNLSVGAGVAAADTASLQVGSKGLKFSLNDNIVTGIRKSVRTSGSATDDRLVTEQGIREAIDAGAFSPIFNSNTSSIGTSTFTSFTDPDASHPGSHIQDNVRCCITTTGFSKHSANQDAGVSSGRTALQGKKVLVFLGLRVFASTNKFNNMSVHSNVSDDYSQPNLGDSHIKFIDISRADGDGLSFQSITVPLLFEIPENGTGWFVLQFGRSVNTPNDYYNSSNAARLCSYQTIILGDI